MRYLFLIFMVIILAGCGAQETYSANPPIDDEIVTDLDGDDQNDFDDTQTDQINNDADEPIDDSEVDDEVITPDPDIVVEEDIDEEPDDEIPDEPIDEEPDEDEVIIPDTCGNGTFDIGEQCDPGMFEVKSCADYVAERFGSPDQTAVTGGNMICRSNCTLDYSGCKLDPHFKMIKGNDGSVHMVYTDTDNSGLELIKSGTTEPDYAMNKFFCSPIYDQYKLKSYPMRYFIFRKFYNLSNPEAKRISEECEVKDFTSFPDNVDETYYSGDKDGEDWKKECWANNLSSTIFTYPMMDGIEYVIYHNIRISNGNDDPRYEQGYLVASKSVFYNGLWMSNYIGLINTHSTPDPGRSVICYNAIAEATNQ